MSKLLRIDTAGKTPTAGSINNDIQSNSEQSPTLVPLVSEDQIDFSLVYALHTFVANLEGQVCVLKGDALQLLDDSNSYWWFVKCIKTDEVIILLVHPSHPKRLDIFLLKTLKYNILLLSDH